MLIVRFVQKTHSGDVIFSLADFIGQEDEYKCTLQIAESF